MYPIYCLSFILNTIWYQEIADAGSTLTQKDKLYFAFIAYKMHYGTAKRTPVATLIRQACYVV